MSGNAVNILKEDHSCLSAKLARTIVFVILTMLHVDLFGQQVYTDFGVHLNTYTQADPLEPKGGLASPSFRLGVSVKEFHENRMRLNIETGFQNRVFDLEYGPQTFRHWTSIFYAGATVDYEVSQKIILESGLFPMFTFTQLEPIPFFPLVSEGKLDEGYRYFDLELMIGGTLLVHEKLGLGMRGRMGMIPMLHYNEIGNYGEIKDAENYMRAWTLEFYIRFLWRTRN